jgi:plastocyanin
MSRRIALIAALAALVAAALATVAIGASAPKTATLTASSGTKVAINKYIQDTSHWAPGTVTIASGGTLTLKEKGGADHSFSIVKASDLPKTAKAVEACKVCQKLATAHGVDPNDQSKPPTNPVVNVGATGVDQPGDSVLMAPKKTEKVKITAKAGTTLRFMCAVHPWMQGKITVK